MNPRRFNELFNQIRRLRLAESDMEIAKSAAKELNARRTAGDVATPVVRALEAGMVVTYCRPFRNGGVGTLDSGWGPLTGVDAQHHEVLLNLRDRMYAHSDTPWRAIAATGEAEQVSYAEAYYDLTVYIDYETVEEISASLERRFREAADGVEALLRAANPPDDWLRERATPQPAGPLET